MVKKSKRPRPAPAAPTVPAAPEPLPPSFLDHHTPAVYVVISLLLLIPCFWQPRIEAGDLSSHIYNAWLAQLIEAGRAPGLVIASQTTNILFDVMLSGCYRLFGADAAQRICVSLAVLVFCWGAFAFISRVAGRRPWHLLFCIAMMAYGWVYHMGFFNFYLSLGLCFWVLALLWDGWKHKYWAAAILVAAYTAHGLPVAWTAGLLLYLWVARRIQVKYHAWLMAGTLLAMLLAHMILAQNMRTVWRAEQAISTTGIDQVWVFDAKYYYVLAALLLIWGALFIQLVRRLTFRGVASSLAFQLCIVSALGVFIMPTTVAIPGFNHALVYIAERMSLGVGICILALLGAAPCRAITQAAVALVAVLFFAFLFRDERALNSFEARMAAAVTKVQPGQRVIGGVEDFALHAPQVTHMIDRSCLGHCFSFANYEPSTAQFRIRAQGPNPYVVDNYRDSYFMQVGQYIVKPGDLPLYKVDLDGRNFVLRGLRPGAPCGLTLWSALYDSPET